MDNPLDYDISESIIKDGAILAEFKNTHYWPVIKELIESEIRSCFRAFLSRTEAKMNDKGEMIETALTEEDITSYRSRAMGAKNILEMIDGKITDMEVWIAQQQKESEKDESRVQEIFSYQRNRIQSEVV